MNNNSIQALSSVTGVNSHKDSSNAQKDYRKALNSIHKTPNGQNIQFNDVLEMEQYLFNSIVSIGSLFNALHLAREINQLNDYKVISDYQLHLIKEYFRSDVNNANGNKKKITVKSNKKNPYHALQKGYMQLLSNWYIK